MNIITAAAVMIPRAKKKGGVKAYLYRLFEKNAYDVRIAFSRKYNAFRVRNDGQTIGFIEREKDCGDRVFICCNKHFDKVLEFWQSGMWTNRDVLAIERFYEKCLRRIEIEKICFGAHK